jgi:large subunit ribosomal protein L31e
MVERIYNIPLRRGWLKAPKWRRSKKAIAVIQEYLQQHTKAKTIKLSKWINEGVWSKGGKNPPSRISVKVDIDKEKSLAKADLVELPKKVKRKEDISKKQELKAKKIEQLKAAEAPEPEETAEEKTEGKAPATMTQKQEMHMH